MGWTSVVSSPRGLASLHWTAIPGDQPLPAYHVHQDPSGVHIRPSAQLASPRLFEARSRPAKDTRVALVLRETLLPTLALPNWLPQALLSRFSPWRIYFDEAGHVRTCCGPLCIAFLDERFPQPGLAPRRLTAKLLEFHQRRPNQHQRARRDKPAHALHAARFPPHRQPPVPSHRFSDDCVRAP
jgi:hypothetical protein